MAGMPEEQVAGLLTEESGTRSRGSGIGLKNVHQRIQLYFGSEYGLEVESEPDEGTTVRIHLPKTEETSSVETVSYTHLLSIRFYQEPVKDLQ